MTSTTLGHKKTLGCICEDITLEVRDEIYNFFGTLTAGSLSKAVGLGIIQKAYCFARCRVSGGLGIIEGEEVGCSKVRG